MAAVGATHDSDGRLLKWESAAVSDEESLLRLVDADSCPAAYDGLMSIRERILPSATYDTGVLLWESSIVMARWLASAAGRACLDGRRVLELGSGCGLSGLAAACSTAASSVTLTDSDPEVLDNLAYNLQLNQKRLAAAVAAGELPAEAEQLLSDERMSVAELDWAAPMEGSDKLGAAFDTIIGSDLYYHPDSIDPLTSVLRAWLASSEAAAAAGRPAPEFLLVMPDNRRDIPRFAAAMDAAGFALRSEVLSAEFCGNPCADGDEDRFVSHYYRLTTNVFTLWRYRWKGGWEEE